MDMTALLNLAGECTARTAGTMLGGIVHNLNNPTHSLAMQCELLASSASRKPAGLDATEVFTKCERLRHVSNDLKDQLDILSWRHAYSSQSTELLDPVHFGTWLLQFWRNNLFFKHNMTVDPAMDPPPPHIRVIPLALLWALEEPLFCLTRFLDANAVQKEYGMRFDIQGLGESGILFAFRVNPVAQSADLALPPLEHAGNIRLLMQSLGWEWRSSSDADLLSVEARSN